MTLTSRQLINLPVFTESGTKIGKILYLELNEKEHLVEKYAIKTSSFIQLIPVILLISPQQVVDINLEQVVVEDSIVKILQKKNKQKNKPAEDPSPVLFIDLTKT